MKNLFAAAQLGITGPSMLHVPYRGGGPAKVRPALMGSLAASRVCFDAV